MGGPKLFTTDSLGQYCMECHKSNYIEAHDIVQIYDNTVCTVATCIYVGNGYSHQYNCNGGSYQYVTQAIGETLT